MPKVTPRKERLHAYQRYSTLVVSQGEAWSEDELHDAARRLYYERMVSTMPKVTDLTYRANAGKDSFNVSPIGRTWDDDFSLMREHPRTFVEFTRDEFAVTTPEGEATDASVATLINRFRLEAYRRGLIIGEQREKIGEKASKKDPSKTVPVYDDNVFRVCLRTRVKDLPEWYVKLHERGIPQDLMPQVEADEDEADDAVEADSEAVEADA